MEQEAFLKTTTEWTKEKLSERLAYYQCELIALHPFYELNGRITRLFFDLIAVYNGYEPIYYSQSLFEETTPLNPSLTNVVPYELSYGLNAIKNHANFVSRSAIKLFYCYNSISYIF